MQKLPASGRVRNIGISNFGICNLKKLLNAKTTTSVLDRADPNNPLPRLAAYNTSKGIYSTGYSCLGSKNSPLNKDPILKEIAAGTGKTSPQVLLNWGLQKGWSVIPKSVNKDRIEANLELDGGV